jgi:hypothetical protein
MPDKIVADKVKLYITFTYLPGNQPSIKHATPGIIKKLAAAIFPIKSKT